MSWNATESVSCEETYKVPLGYYQPVHFLFTSLIIVFWVIIFLINGDGGVNTSLPPSSALSFSFAARDTWNQLTTTDLVAD